MKKWLQHRRGFTLVELLVATAVTLVLAGLLVSVATNVLRAWQRSGGELEGAAQAALVLDLLERDLRAAVLRRDGRVWLAATGQPDQSGAGDSGGSLASWTAVGGVKPGWSMPGTVNSSLQLNPTSGRLEDARFGMAGVWLRFITTVPDDNRDLGSTSAPRVVAYQLVRHALTSGPGSTVRYSLFRAEVRPSGDRSAFTTGYDLFGDAYNKPAVGGTNLADPGTVRRPRRDQLLANNVIDFGVRIWTRDAGGAPAIAFPRSPTNLGFAATARDGTASLDAAWGANPALPPAAASVHFYPVGEMTYGFPDGVEVFVRILTEEGARQIEAFESGRSSAQTWWEIALAHSLVQSRWIPIGSSAP